MIETVGVGVIGVGSVGVGSVGVGLVGVGSTVPEGLIVRVNIFEALMSVPAEAITVNCEVPALVGVPEILPLLRDNPAGRVFP